MIDNKQIVERFFRTFNERNWNDLPSILTPDCAHGADYGPKYTGIKDITSHYEAFIENGAESKWLLDRMTAEEDVVVVEFRWASNHVIEMLDIPPTGKRFQLPVVFILDFEKGKIQKIRALFSYRLYKQILAE
jgi:predicted ester cyclase